MLKYSEKYCLGLDAGGTGTSVLVSDGENQLFRTGTEGLNCNSFSPEQILTSLQSMTARLLQKGTKAVPMPWEGICSPRWSKPWTAEDLPPHWKAACFGI